MNTSCRINYTQDGNIDHVVANNGERSILYDSLRDLIGEQPAVEYYSLTNSPNFQNVVDAKIFEHRNKINNLINKSQRAVISGLNIEKKGVNGRLVYEPTINGKKAGGIRLLPFKDGFKIESVAVYDDFQNQKLAKTLYLWAAKNLVKQGKNLYSLTSRAPYADKIWKGLVSEGIAIKEGANYVVKSTPPIIDENGEADVKTVAEYANTTGEELSRDLVIGAQDSAMAFGVSTNYELASKLEEAFVDSNGFIIFDRTKMRLAGYTDYEITKVLSDYEIQKSIKENFPRVKNSDFTLDYVRDSVEPKDNVFNAFGKMVVENPFINEKNKQPQQNVKVIKEGKLVDQTSYTEAVLLKSYPETPKPISNALSHLFNTIAVVREDVISSNNESVKKVVREIKKEVVDYGVDLRNIEDRLFPANKLKDFTAALESYITNPSSEFAEIYDEFFEINDPITEPSKAETVNDVLVDTELSEYELFRDHNLIRKEGNLYTKVAPIENLFEVFAMTQDEIKSREQLEPRVNEMEITDSEFDSETLENMLMWKMYLGTPIKTESNEKVDTIDIREVINNPYKVATSSGVELINTDPITASRAEMYETEEAEVTNLNLDDSYNKRVEALKNPQSVEKITTDYNIVEDGVLITKNNESSFVRVGNEVFERTHAHENLSFFAPVESEAKNLSDIDYSKYYLSATTEDNWVDAKLPTKSELKNINEQNFNCN